jgi:hypothetical protein
MSYVFKACILVGAAIVIAASTVANPAHLFANIPVSFADLTASLVDNLWLQPHTDRPTPITQSTADAQSAADAHALPQPAVEKPIINIVAASQPAVQTEAEPQSNDALFRQFQAWVDAQADAAPAQAIQNAPEKVVQSAPTQFADSPRTPIPLMKKRRAVAHNTRLELPIRSPRKPSQPVQNARAQVPPSLSAEPQWTLRSQ